MNIVWFIAMFLFVLLEVGHPGLFYFLSFSSGSFLAFIISYQGYSLSHQLVIFFVGSLVTLVLLHLFVKQKLQKMDSSQFHRSNIDQLIGKKVTITVVNSDDAKKGYGKIGGEEWAITLLGEQLLQVGKKVFVVGVQGCRLQVTYNVVKG